MGSNKKAILNVGLACLDIVMLCETYPEEDSDQRCQSCEWRRGGNASNNSTLMVEYGVKCEYFGTMSTDYGGKYLKESFGIAGINCENCVFYDNRECPSAVILINAENGSRTIVHSNKDLPELKLEDFKKLDLSKYKWINFEGRPSLKEIRKMIDYVNEWNKSTTEPITISLELEKPKYLYVDSIDCAADIVFISKDLAMMCNHNTMESAVEDLCRRLSKPNAILICPWGEKGACAKSIQTPLVMSPAFPPPKVVDTLAAGDVFVATTIICMANGKSVQESITNACQVAGAKCGLMGMRGLGQLIPLL